MNDLEKVIYDLEDDYYKLHLEFDEGKKPFVYLLPHGFVEYKLSPPDEKGVSILRALNLSSTSKNPHLFRPLLSIRPDGIKVLNYHVYESLIDGVGKVSIEKATEKARLIIPHFTKANIEAYPRVVSAKMITVKSN